MKLDQALLHLIFVAQCSSFAFNQNGNSKQKHFQKQKHVLVAPLASSTSEQTEEIEAGTLASILTNDDDAKSSRTQRIMEKTSDEQSSGAGGSSTYEAFLRVEANWQRLKESKALTGYDEKLLNGNAIPTFITSDGAQGNPRAWEKLREIGTNGVTTDYDVVVCGGTLGIFIATALLIKNPELRISVVEGGKLKGRAQEWNISRAEMEELVELGVLTQDEVEKSITTEFPGCRSGFKNREVTPLKGGYFENDVGYECVTPNVLNCGVAPAMLIDMVKDRFESLGGTVMESTRIGGVVVSELQGAAIDLVGDDVEPLTSRLVLDCMGNASPISRQQRYGMKPDGVCAVVGSCASGFDKETNLIGDIIYTNSEIQDKGDNGKLQYFWEAFPVGIGRPGGLNPGESDVKTTYMFTYFDADEKRPSLNTLMDDYWDLLPKYQPSITNPETDLDVQRVLFAYFPTYRDSPLQPKWSRVLAVGDASGIQSPLSFGGFGALTRHLGRLSDAITDALEANCLHRDDLALINPYTPNLSAAWMFQKAMSVKIGQGVDSKFVNRLLATNFQIMDDMGKKTIMPFLQDVVRLDGLLGSLSRSFVADPTFMPQIVAHVGLPRLLDWMGHVSMIALYTGLHSAVTPVLKPLVMDMKDQRKRFQLLRQMEAWEYGSGMDYKFEEE
mmetsp:Transcript_17627/g.26240  ORF Transcript_17627/g.26240 Transcript_17627/m.26240 type:complete len:671 (-) Transcript_17627:108-2120(-)|eukprot:CAMPEP_0116020778 /NCGR_PEP_ID=MMETSP0321-20121206/9999_1 /TAXON_ID=163516 /ORGANISM="Leptocylindrus danicus var. danicus, Strain B650" /LENGTH=670 /DNA_ID=CAMNT_0003491533 /DNA_START=59 /DNA_END=2071 /DNA_ORIENTATION=+